ncbi:MAG TPA: carbamoyltransferase [candidate division Zixibacteria bacterium]|nr:carbamoyltransferase [candidate division Zixibacteria bacterium]
MTTIAGISAFYHDAAAALLVDGRVVAAAQEERFSRTKGDARFPQAALHYCLGAAGVEIDDLDYLVFYDKPLTKFDRLLETYLAIAPAGYRSLIKGIPVWTKEKLWLENLIHRESGYQKEVFFGEHHESHAASAFYPSPFQSAAILTVDGVGEWSTTCIGRGAGAEVTLSHEIRFPHSLGLLYSAFTYYLGFKVNSGEYKLMGLAPYGEPAYVDTILRELIDLKSDGSFRLNMRYFNYLGGLTMTNERFHRLFGGAPREPEGALEKRHMDLARSIQEVTEEIMLRLARTAQTITGEKNLCLAGGVVLNCVANGKILRDGAFESIWIQPASGDAGGALGAALAFWHRYLEKPRAPIAGDSMQGALLGPEYSDEAIRRTLDGAGVAYRTLARAEIARETARLLADGAVVGWFQGRLEYGPRALGSRSILGDPRDPQMQTRMNVKIKFRESFRPFAPVVKEDKVSDWFDLACPSPYMLLVADVRPDKRRAADEAAQGADILARLNRPRSEIQAVTHVDYSARVQTVNRYLNPLYYDTLDEFERLTGCPVLVNTSFNVRGEPIVCTPEDALRCFLRTEMDYLVIGSFIVDASARGGQHPEEEWRADLPLD